MKKHKLYTLKIHGIKGGRDYLRMVHQAIPEEFTVTEITDFKRYYSKEKWRKARHLLQIVQHIPYKDKKAFFLWDDLSLVTFSKEMLEKTIFIVHHYDPITFDSGLVEFYLWERLFKALKYCYAVICVSPYWASFLEQKGIKTKIIYNSFDMTLISKITSIAKDELKDEFNLPKDKINVYLGKAERFKGVEAIFESLNKHDDLNLVTSGKNELNLPINNYNYLEYLDYLKLIYACDVGIFNSEVKEGWTRCAVEAILLRLPCLLKPIAGLEDLADLSLQKKLQEYDICRLHKIIVERIEKVTEEETTNSYNTLAKFDVEYFRKEWSCLLRQLSCI